MENKTWLQVEMEETVALLRKRLEKLNGLDPDGVDEDAVCEIHKIYETLHLIHCMEKPA